MQFQVNISQVILEWVMASISLDTLPPKITTRLQTWISGEKVPTFNQVEDVSKATGIPLGYFFLQAPPKEDVSLLNYRTIDSVELHSPSRNLMDTIHDMEQIQEWMYQYQLSINAEALPFVGTIHQSDSLEKFVNVVRDTLSITEDWFITHKNTEDAFRYIRQAISTSGTIVMMNGIVGSNTHRPLSIDEFRAFALTNNYAPLIFVNSNDSTNGRLFSILHEFAHICMGENSFFNDRYGVGSSTSKGESICNAVAAEVLVPQRIFVQKWNSNIEELNAEKTIDALVKIFKCGSTVIARRALDFGYISGSLYQKISNSAIARYNESCKKRKENPGGDFYRTAASRIDHRFFKILTGSVLEGKTLYSDAFRLTNTNRATYATLSEQIGGGRLG